MAKVIRRATINAPIDKVFTFLEDKRHLPEIWPSMVEVSNVERLPNGGSKFHYKYKMAGLQFEGDTDEIEHVRNRKMVDRDVSGLDRTVTWTFDPKGNTTDLTFEADYRLPKPVLQKIDEKVAERLNANEADTVLANVRAALET